MTLMLLKYKYSEKKYVKFIQSLLSVHENGGSIRHLTVMISFTSLVKLTIDVKANGKQRNTRIFFVLNF